MIPIFSAGFIDEFTKNHPIFAVLIIAFGFVIFAFLGWLLMSDLYVNAR